MNEETNPYQQGKKKVGEEKHIELEEDKDSLEQSPLKKKEVDCCCDSQTDVI